MRWNAPSGGNHMTYPRPKQHDVEIPPDQKELEEERLADDGNPNVKDKDEE